MPTGIYKRTKIWEWKETSKKRMSDICMGRKLSEEAKRKIGLFNKGKKLSEETKKKVSISRKKRKEKLGFLNSLETRRKMSEAKKGKISPQKGKKREKHTIEWRKAMSIVFKGKNHPNWKGGITPLNKQIRQGIEFRLWREAVFARDNWTCQKTKTKGGELHPHHIQNFADFPELRFAIDNGITLSTKAHREFHNKYGFKNNTKQQIEEFLFS